MAAKLRDKIAKEFTFYSMSFAWMQVINVLIAIYIRNALGPEQMGVWIALQVILTYTKYSNLGLAEAAGREIPFEKGQGHLERVDGIRNASYTFTVGVSAVLSLAMAAASFFVYRSFGKLYGISLLVLAFLSFFQRASTFCIVMARAERRFDFLNRFNVYSSTVNAVLIVLLVHFFRLNGYYAAMVLSFVFNYFYLLGFSGISFRLQWNWPLLVSLFRMGVVLVFVNLAYTFFSSVDKISITAFLNVKELGVYSIAILAGNLILMLPNNLSVIIFPYLNEAYGASPEPDKMKKFVLLPNEFVAYYLPILIGFLSILSPILVHIFLPKYTEGVLPLQIGLWTSLFAILSGNMGNALITFKKYGWMIPLQLLLAFAAWKANAFLVHRGFGLPAVAATNLLAYALLWVSYMAVFFKVFSASSLLMRHVAKITAVVGYASAAAVILDFCVPQQTVSAVLLKLAVWSAASAPILLLGEKAFETRRLFQKLLSKSKKLPESTPAINAAGL